MRIIRTKIAQKEEEVEMEKIARNMRLERMDVAILGDKISPSNFKYCLGGFGNMRTTGILLGSHTPPRCMLPTIIYISNTSSHFHFFFFF